MVPYKKIMDLFLDRSEKGRLQAILDDPKHRWGFCICNAARLWFVFCSSITHNYNFPIKNFGPSPTPLNRSAKDTGTQTSSFRPFQRKLSATNLGLTNLVYKERLKALSIKTLIHFLLSSSFCQNRFNCSRESAIGNTSAVDAEAKLLDIMQSDFLALLGAFKLVVVTVLLILICQGFLFQGFVNKHAL